MLHSLNQLDGEHIELAQRIRQAFPKVPIPDEQDIIGEALDRITHPEDRWIVQAFGNRSWLEIDPEQISAHWNSLWLFTAESFRYYLPAYLMASLLMSSDTMLYHTIVRALLPPPVGLIRPLRDFEQFTQGFSSEHRQVISRYLEVMKAQLIDSIDISDKEYEAARNYWQNNQNEA
jgi:hypothetical protein